MNQKKNKPTDNPSSGDGGGIIFLNKSTDITSFQALGRIKKVLNTGKVGHTGTLDKFAEGLLILLTGKFTRMNSVITDLDKEYEALICFGRETDTLDPEGETVAEADPPSLEEIQSVLDQFRGTIQQVPPRFSAIHIDGKRAHELARSGKEVDMPTREVTIHKLEILEYEKPCLRLQVHCSKGTYIRSLARDLGRASGSRAYVKALKRTAVGPFDLSEAVRAEDFKGCGDFVSWESFFLKLDNTCVLELNDRGIDKMRNGVTFRREFLSNPGSLDTAGRCTRLLLKNNEGHLKAVLEPSGGGYKYKINLCV
ncbi:MAG: tRNA pseudouridine(55) synthase TruB [Spirochaetales bacterium]|nr:tRNA pseudouridine(55) synthase TruB [Spirochaetales bacterium]